MTHTYETGRQQLVHQPGELQGHNCAFDAEPLAPTLLSYCAGLLSGKILALQHTSSTALCPPKSNQVC
jgi:hypothetical protein